MERVLVAFAGEEALRRMVRLLESGGVRPAGCCFSGAEVIRRARRMGGALVVCGFKLRDMTAGHLAAELGESGTVLVVSSAANLDLCEGENLVKLPTPASRSELFASLDLLRQGRPRPAAPRQEAECQLIRGAKELLMDVNRMTEPEAHRFLQKRSMDAGLKLAETARMVIEELG